MKKTNRLSMMVCVLLVVCMVLPLCACPDGNVPPAETTTASSDTSSTTSSSATTGPVVPPIGDTAFPNGEKIKEAGDRIKSTAAALTSRKGDRATGEALSPDDFSLYLAIAMFAPDTTYVATAATPVEWGYPSGEYDGAGAVVYLDGGLQISGAEDMTLRNITIVGAVTFFNCQGITLDNVQVYNTAGTALSVVMCEEVEITDCRFEGKTALENGTDNLILRTSYLGFTQTGISDAATTGTLVRDCRFVGKGVAMTTASAELNVMYNTFTMEGESVGVEFKKGEGDVPVNGIVALNVINGAQDSVVFDNVKNSVVLLNTLVSATVKNSRDVYVVENNMGGRVVALNNNYIIADQNVFPEDELDHTAVQSGNQNTNGDTITDVDARAEVGANEDLLPHVDKDQFVGVECKTSIHDYDGGKDYAPNKYIMQKAALNDIVIVAPGAYACNETIYLANMSNVRIYGYGVYIEHTGNLGAHFRTYSVRDVSFNGFTLGYDRVSCGQVYIVEKTEPTAGQYHLKVYCGAGMVPGFAGTSAYYYNMVYGHHAADSYNFCDTSVWNCTQPNANGMMEMDTTGGLYAAIKVGDVLTCRESGGERTIQITYSQNVSMTDVTLFGAASAFALHEEYNSGASTFLRMANTTKNGALIDADTYSRYRQLEQQYKISFNISVDEKGRYRGSVPRIGSVDASHAISNKEGASFTSCLFENMCDDGTNQGAFHARLHAVKDNGDGTLTLTYKGNIGTQTWNDGVRTCSVLCANFNVGDTVSVYTSEGKQIYRGPALSATVAKSDINVVIANRDNFNTTAYIREVTVSSEGFDTAGLTGYDLTSNNITTENKVLVDNESWASAGFRFDNVLIQNIRSRGLLLKASDGTITNCTMRNIGMAAVACLYEINWGESGQSSNLTITNNYMENTGHFSFSKYFPDPNIFSPITVWGLGTGAADEDHTLYHNITISGNVIRKRSHADVSNYNDLSSDSVAVCLRAVRNVTITNNDFGSDNANVHYSIRFIGAVNVEVSGNVYPRANEVVGSMKCDHVKNIYGSDVEDAAGNPLISDR